MTNEQALDKINEGLTKILKDTYKWCDADDEETAEVAVSINEEAHEIKTILERYRNRGYSN